MVPSFTDKLALGEVDHERRRRVAVTGGSGKLGAPSSPYSLHALDALAGRSTVKYLADEGWEVINLDTRRPAGASEDGKSGTPAYRIIEIDLSGSDHLALVCKLSEYLQQIWAA